jgi:hypothetical protein
MGMSVVNGGAKTFVRIRVILAHALFSRVVAMLVRHIAHRFNNANDSQNLEA